MRLATVGEAKCLDELTQSKFSVSAESLMEAAGSQAAREIEQNFMPELRTPDSWVAIFCGPGHNGGDGLVIARHLAGAGYRVRAICLAGRSQPSELFQLQLGRAKAAGVECRPFDNGADAVQSVVQSRSRTPVSVAVDALFGIGFKGRIEGAAAEVIEFLNSACKVPVVAVDTPSGLDADRGFPGGGGPAVRATMTITFGLAKPGFFVGEGPRHLGKLRVLPIGFPLEAMRECASSTFAFGERQAARRIPRWASTSHKTDHGHALIFAGSPGMFGAGVLASHAAYRVGAGYVTLASHSDPVEIIGRNPEILTGRADDEKFWKGSRWTAAAIGPGLGTSQKTRLLLERLMAVEGSSRVVVDADAITVAATHRLFPFPREWLITPHAGELSRVLGVGPKEIEADRFRFAREAQRYCGCHVLLKGFRTVVAAPERASVVLSGNAALAKAGTGDVLTGLITGLMAQGLATEDAALTGAFIHGRIADEWVAGGRAKSSLMAGDLARLLPSLIERLRRSRRSS